MKALDFLREVKVELEKVVWPTRAQTIRLTFIVIFITIMVAFFVGVVDFGLVNLSQYLIQ
jgi:preprotein translocase subunit SecE